LGFFKRKSPMPGTSQGQLLSDLSSTYGPPPISVILNDGRTLASWKAHHSLTFGSDGRCCDEVIRGPSEMELSWRFRRLGNMTALNAESVITVAGPPNSRSSGAGYTLLQWQETRPGGAYHLAIKFDSTGLFSGITHQHATRPR